MFVCLAAVLGAMAFPSSNRVVVFVSPWSSNDAVLNVINKANGEIVNTAKKDWIAIGQSKETGFIFRLYQSGALLVLSADFATACLPKEFFERKVL